MENRHKEHRFKDPDVPQIQIDTPSLIPFYQAHFSLKLLSYVIPVCIVIQYLNQLWLFCLSRSIFTSNRTANVSMLQVIILLEWIIGSVYTLDFILKCVLLKKQYVLGKIFLLFVLDLAVGPILLVFDIVHACLHGGLVSPVSLIVRLLKILTVWKLFEILITRETYKAIKVALRHIAVMLVYLLVVADVATVLFSTDVSPYFSNTFLSAVSLMKINTAKDSHNIVGFLVQSHPFIAPLFLVIEISIWLALVLYFICSFAYVFINKKALSKRICGLGVGATEQIYIEKIKPTRQPLKRTEMAILGYLFYVLLFQKYLRIEYLATVSTYSIFLVDTQLFFNVLFVLEYFYLIKGKLRYSKQHNWIPFVIDTMSAPAALIVSAVELALHGYIRAGLVLCIFRSLLLPFTRRAFGELADFCKKIWWMLIPFVVVTSIVGALSYLILITQYRDYFTSLYESFVALISMTFLIRDSGSISSNIMLLSYGLFLALTVYIACLYFSLIAAIFAKFIKHIHKINYKHIMLQSEKWMTERSMLNMSREDSTENEEDLRVIRLLKEIKKSKQPVDMRVELKTDKFDITNVDFIELNKTVL